MPPELRTVNELWDYLDEESSWRKVEISTLQGALSDQTTPQGLASLLRRAGPMMLYAHWEGFVKEAGEGYLELVCQRVNRNKMALHRLEPHFRALALYKGFQSQKGPQVMQFVKEVRAFITMTENQHIRFHRHELIDTGSNLDLKAFLRICDVINLDVSILEPVLQVLDARVVNPRHRLAHGGRLAPEIDDFLKTSREVVKAIDDFKEIVQEAALSEKYLALP